MLYTWCDIISQHKQSGNDYSLLKPVYSIWLLAENLLPGETEQPQEYKLQNRQGHTLADLGGIHLREQRTIQIEREEDLREMEGIKQENERIQHDMEQAQQDLQREQLEN